MCECGAFVAVGRGVSREADNNEVKMTKQGIIEMIDRSGFQGLPHGSAVRLA